MEQSMDCFIKFLPDSHFNVHGSSFDKVKSFSASFLVLRVGLSARCAAGGELKQIFQFEF